MCACANNNEMAKHILCECPAINKTRGNNFGVFRNTHSVSKLFSKLHIIVAFVKLLKVFYLITYEKR